MREQEGKKLSEDLAHSLQVILAHVDHIELASERIVADYRTRLESKIKEVLADKTMDESRVLTEVAIFADRMCVAEEIVRIRSHALQFEQFLHADEPVGRKMNFLVQELNREVNTIGSKISDMDISTRVVEMKAELEKIREQIQNVE